MIIVTGEVRGEMGGGYKNWGDLLKIMNTKESHWLLGSVLLEEELNIRISNILCFYVYTMSWTPCFAFYKN